MSQDRRGGALVELDGAMDDLRKADPKLAARLRRGVRRRPEARADRLARSDVQKDARPPPLADDRGMPAAIMPRAARTLEDMPPVPKDEEESPATAEMERSPA